MSIVVGVITAIAAIASAAQQAQAQKQAAKQSEYDAEFEATQRRMDEEQERMNREQARKVEGRLAEDARRKRISMLTAAGGGIGVSALQELSRQASIDELDIQNADLLSTQRRKGMRRSATNSLLAGKFRSSSLKARSRSTMASGVGRAAGSIGSSFK
jgi:hypothetical protein